MTITSADIATLIKDLLAEKGISQNEFGRRFGKSSGRISERFNGKYEWKVADLFPVAEYLGVTAESIVAELKRREDVSGVV